jgi:hypothetical protein
MCKNTSFTVAAAIMGLVGDVVRVLRRPGWVLRCCGRGTIASLHYPKTRASRRSHIARSSDMIRFTPTFSIAVQAAASEPPVSIPRQASSTT